MSGIVNNVEISKTEDTNEDDDIGNVLNNVGFGKFHVLVVFTGFIGAVADAMELLMIGVIGQPIRCEWLLSDFEVALFSTVVFVGYLIGSGVWGVISDVYGRRPAIILSLCVTSYFSLLCGIAPNFNWLLVLRGLVGFGLSGSPIGFVYVAEVIPNRLRARIVLSATIFWCIGTIVESALALWLLPLPSGWRFLVGVTSVPLLAAAAIFYIFPESPHYYKIKGDTANAIKSLQVIAKWNGVEIDSDVRIRKQPCVKSKLSDLFHVKLRLITLKVSVIALLITFIYYSIVLYTTESVPGIASPTENTHLIEDCVVSCNTSLPQKSYIYIMIAASAELPGTIVGIALSEIISRKKLISFGTLGVAVGIGALILVVDFLNSAISRLCALFLIRASITMTLNTFYLYGLELYPTFVRSMAVGWVGIWARVGAICSPFVAQLWSHSFQIVTLLVYTAAAIVTCIISWTLPLDSQGHALPDVI